MKKKKTYKKRKWIKMSGSSKEAVEKNVLRFQKSERRAKDKSERKGIPFKEKRRTVNLEVIRE